MTRRTITRREAMGLIGAAGLWAATAACSEADPESADDTSSGEEGVAADESSTGTDGAAAEGDLHLRLWAEPTTAEIVAGTTTPVWSFGGEVVSGDPSGLTASDSYLGPTLRFRTGQRVRIDFENRLEEESIVHWHGLVVPQDQDGQPADAIEPGATYQYEFTVPNEPGTHWYHPHPHTRTGEQVYRGLAGLLIVDGADGGDGTDLPTGDDDLGLVIQDRTVAASGELAYVATMHDTMAGFVGSTLVANGRAGREIPVPQGPIRLRLLNGSNAATRRLTWSTGDPLTVVATDGHLLPEAVDVDGLVLTPAQRSDLWVDFSELDPGTAVDLLAAEVFIEAGMGMGMGGGGGAAGAVGTPAVAARFVVGDGGGDGTPASRPSRLGRAPDLDEADAVNAGDPKQFVLSTFRAAHWINDTQWEGRSVTEVETVEAGATEVWEFVNRSPMAHPMHLHGAPFLVVERGWEDDTAADGWEEIAGGVVDAGLRDTVLVWPGQRVRIVTRFADHLGFFLYHCHILEHEDAGMMRSYRVV